MPCDTVQESSVDLDALGKVDETRLTEAAEALGYTLRRVNGKLEVVSRRSVPDLAALKREYATRTVQAAAKRFGWRVQQREAVQTAKGQQVKLTLGR